MCTPIGNLKVLPDQESKICREIENHDNLSKDCLQCPNLRLSAESPLPTWEGDNPEDVSKEFMNSCPNRVMTNNDLSGESQLTPSIETSLDSVLCPNNDNIGHDELLDPPQSLNPNPKINEDDPKASLQALKAKNVDRPIVAHININFLASKFEPLESLIKDNIDILLVSETKLDETFPSGQFVIKGYGKPIRLDRNRGHGGGVLFFIHDDLPCRELKSHKLPGNVEGIFIEISLGKTKWLILGGYNPHKDTISYFLSHISKELDKLLPSYENILLMGDFNSCMSENAMQEFCEMYSLENLIKGPTCYKNALNPSSIDLMLTNKKLSFQNSMTLETGLSDHHKMTISVLKKHFKKQDPITMNYRNFKSMDEQRFRTDLIQRLKQFESLDIDNFKELVISVLDNHAPLKKKVLRGNNAPFMNKTLSKEFMHRSKLKNQYHKNPTESNKEAYKKQRNFCVGLVQKEKKKYYNNLDIKIFSDNKKFWQKVKPLFSEKSNLKRNITIVENDAVISDKTEVAEKLNTFFIEVVENLEIKKFLPNSDDDHESALPQNVKGKIDSIIKKYDSHPSIMKIKVNVNLEGRFSFCNVTQAGIQNEINAINPKKASVENDVPAKILKENKDIFSLHLSRIYNESKNNNTFPVSLKNADVSPIHKEKETTATKNYRPVSVLPILSKVYERNMYDSILSYIDKFLSPYLLG